MYLFFVGTLAECQSILAIIQSELGEAYSMVYNNHGVYYVPFLATDAETLGTLGITGIGYDDFMTQYWREEVENETD